MRIDKKFIDELWGRETKLLALLKTKYSGTPKTLWQWQMQCPLEERWANFIGANTKFGNFVSQGGSQKREGLAVLDLGCGFGMYWPILAKLGFKKFVGIDLFDLRISRQFGGRSHIKQTLSLLLHGKPRATLRSLRPRPKTENYLAAAHDFVQATCPEIEYQLIEGDVANIANYELKFNPFDLICAYSVNSFKLGATGIPPALFENTVEKYARSNCHTVYWVNENDQ